MNLYFSKLYVFLLLTLCRLISGLCPLIISRKLKRKYGLENINKKWIEWSVSCSMDFSGGILLATCFIHMIPEVRDHLQDLLKEKYQFPYAETLVCIGFFIVFVIEESVTHMLGGKSMHHEPVKKSSALITPRVNDSLTTVEINNRSRVEDHDREMTATADMNGDGAGNGLNITIGMAANNGLMIEMNPMLRTDINECNNNTKSPGANNLRNFLLITALSFHSVMEGLAIGLAQNVEDVWFLFLAVTVHECAILLCVGIEMVASCSSASTIIIYIVTFALVSPLGVLFGTVITFSASDVGTSFFHLMMIGILQGLAAGTILYVTFFEVLNNHKHHHNHGRTHQSHSGLPKLIFIALGFVSMVVLELVGGHNGSHYSGHHEYSTNNNSSY